MNFELELVLDKTCGPVLRPECLQKYFAARKVDFADVVLILYRGFKYEHLRCKYFNVVWLLDTLIKDVVVIVKLDNKPRINLPLRAEMYLVGSK